MKLAAAVLALAAAVSAHNNVTYVTEVVDVITTYCPEPTTITYGTETITVTEPGEVTITNCPCTIKRPVTTISSVICNDNCPTPTPSAIPSPKPPVYNNGTVPVVPSPSHTIGTVTRPAPPAATTPTGTSTSTPPIVTAGAGKVAALSGAGLAGLLGVAAFVL